jgi:hypothetical protein
MAVAVDALAGSPATVMSTGVDFLRLESAECLEVEVPPEQALEIARCHTQKVILSRNLMTLRKLIIQPMSANTLYYHPFFVVRYTDSRRVKVLDLLTGSWEGPRMANPIIKALSPSGLFAF